MIIPKANIKLIYQHVLNEGVLVVKKDVRAPRHEEIPVPNLQVMKCLQSLKSRGYVTEEFNWQYHYFFLTDDGIAYLRQYLHLPDSVQPQTILKASPSAGRLPGSPREDGEERRGPRRDGGEYRRRTDGAWRNKEAPAATSTA